MTECCHFWHPLGFVLNAKGSAAVCKLCLDLKWVTASEWAAQKSQPDPNPTWSGGQSAEQKGAGNG